MKKIDLSSTPVLFFLTCIVSFQALAQKLPNKQEVSLRAPANIKVDGKATEWDNQLQAYNKTTQVYYTIANNDDNIYLIVQATDPIIIRKLITHGLVFTITPQNKKPTTVTYPLITSDDSRSVFTALNTNVAKNLSDSIAIRKKNDSLVIAMNKKLGELSKEIAVEGIIAITDEKISIYNEAGIKTAMLFDNKKVFTCELAIPIKLLGTTGMPGKLSYSLKLNGAPPSNVTTVLSDGYVRRSSPGNLTVEMKATPQVLASLAAESPTDFTGEYTLAKK